MSSWKFGARSVAAVCALCIVAVASVQSAAASGNNRLDFLGEVSIATGTQFEDTEVGGLSSIDYDARNDRYYAICDDRSTIDPARFYTLKIDLSDGRLDDGDVSVHSVVTLLDRNGLPFAPGSVDPESLRYDPRRNTLLWTSEGDANALIPPFVREATLAGAFVREFSTPPRYFPTADQTAGIRNNLAFESLTFGPAQVRAVTATENALYQDGPAASLADRSPARMLEFGVFGALPKREYVYLTETVAKVPDPATGFSTNGLVELLSLAPRRYLSVERSFSNNVGNTIRVFVVDTARATNVAGLDSIDGQTIRPVAKTLIADFGDYGIVSDNIEGVTLGPILANGRRTLLFVSDNNFSATQKTQFLAFSFRPGALVSASEGSDQ